MRLEIVADDGRRLSSAEATACRDVACRAGLHILTQADDGMSWSMFLADPVREVALTTALQKLAEQGVRATVMVE
jgi:hypothetical protein